jgi:hypothetical protein
MDINVDPIRLSFRPARRLSPIAKDPQMARNHFASTSTVAA